MPEETMIGSPWGAPPTPPPAKAKKEKHPLAPDVSELSTRISDIDTRLKLLEDRQVNLQKKSQVTEHNMLTSNRTFLSDIKIINSDISEIKNDLTEIKNKLKEVIAQLATFARKEDVKVLEKYINMWEPIKYVTEKDVVKIVKHILESK